MMKRICTSVCLLALLAPSGAAAQEAEVTANVGFVSEYFYRGIPQKPTSASGGLDVALGGLYLGTWAADVGDGNEVDLYAGYGFDLDQVSLSIGGTGYFYTGDFDETYLEANFGAGAGPLGVEFSYGQWEGDPEQNYWFLGITGEHEGLYATFGTFGEDFEGEYGEAGYTFTVAELDMALSWIYSTDEILGAPDDDHTLVFGISRTFDIL